MQKYKQLCTQRGKARCLYCEELLYIWYRDACPHVLKLHGSLISSSST